MNIPVGSEGSELEDWAAHAYPDEPQKIAATGQTTPQESGLRTAHNPQVTETPGHSFPICLQENCLAYNTLNYRTWVE